MTEKFNDSKWRRELNETHDVEHDCPCDDVHPGISHKAWDSQQLRENFVDQFLDFNKDNVNFYNAVENLKAKDMNKRYLLKLAKKFNVDPKDALRFVKEMWITKL
tara:strand:+ start:1042 stop:1356 length:315 start_codon:yes stop_codon:yes gene_type:complete